MKIGIVNDLGLAVEALRRAVVDAGGHQLAWVAHNGFEAVALCASAPPDLVLMDLIMPRMDGVEATRRIMAATPCPVLVVTSNIRDNCSQVFEAMGAGALDAVNTPVWEGPGAWKGAAALIAKIESVARLLGEQPPSGKLATRPATSASRLSRRNPLIVMGASAGGPAALATVLGALPADFPAAILIVQHVDGQFSQGLASWLDYQTPLPVRLAQEGDRPEAGTALLARGEDHLVFVSPHRLSYAREPAEASYRPSVDVFFKSAARFWANELVGVLLTGMGRDGADGLRTLLQHGHHTIAQNRATSAVYGMPKAAAELNAAAEILALDKIGPRLKAMVTRLMNVHA